MSKDLAISFKNVYQSYPLYPNPREMIKGVLGINKLLRRESNIPLFHALKGINLDIYKGQRLGIVGQNGAGKTTLLKLATSNFFPTSGKVEIYGKVQSLMDSGVGFHPEFTGMDNIRSSLIYNGLTVREMKEAIEDIIEFSELGEFINQPLKTYSLGMMSRLAFATSTALKPEILIIDEIMGAGDAYFAAKSAERMKNLTKDGTTLLLVSHSSVQVTQFCKQAIWMKEGQINMQGDVLEVCKAYEIYMRELDEKRLERLNEKKKIKGILKVSSSEDETCLKEEENNEEAVIEIETSVPEVSTQEQNTELQEISSLPQRSLARWKGIGSLKIEEFYILDKEDKKRFTYETGEEIKFIMKVSALEEGHYPCTYVMFTYTLSGQPVTLHSYEEESYFEKGQVKEIQITYPKLMLGSGDFVISLALYKQLNLDDTSTALFYDLLDRSYEFKVINKFKEDRTTFLHPEIWEIKG